MKRLILFVAALSLLACQGAPSTVRPLTAGTKKSQVVTTPKPGGTPTPGPTATPTPAADATPTPTPTPTGASGGTGSNAQLGLVVGQQGADTWLPGPSLARPRAGLAVGIAGDQLLAIEGDGRPSMEVLAPTSDGWRVIADYDITLGEIPANPQIGGRSLMVTGQGSAGVVVAGGHASGGGASRETHGYGGTGYLGSTGNFSTYFEAAGGGLISGTLIAAGGRDRTGAFTSICRLLHVELGKETAGAGMPAAVAGAASAVANGKLFLLGGYTLDGNGKPVAQKSVQIYDPSANRWRRDGDGEANAPAALPVALHSAAACVIGTKLVLAGGVDANGNVLADVRVLDLETNSWSAGAAMPTPRALLAMTAYNGRAWAIGGFGAGRQALTTVEVYRP